MKKPDEMEALRQQLEDTQKQLEDTQKQRDEALDEAKAEREHCSSFFQAFLLADIQKKIHEADLKSDSSISLTWRQADELVRQHSSNAERHHEAVMRAMTENAELKEQVAKLKDIGPNEDLDFHEDHTTPTPLPTFAGLLGCLVSTIAPKIPGGLFGDDEKPVVSSFKDAILCALSNSAGKFPRGYGDTTITNAINYGLEEFRHVRNKNASPKEP